MSYATIRSLMFLPLLAATCLNAQMDSRLQACKTDVLDVYSGGKKGAKPEIITLIDNSGSMEALAWDERFYTKPSAQIHVAASNAFGNSSDDNSVGYFRVVASTLYDDATHGNIKYTVRFGDRRGGVLIKPDGKPVTYTDTGSSTDIQKWVARASHVRFAVTSDASASYTYDSISYAIPSNNCSISPRPLSTAGEYSSTTAAAIATADHIRVVDIPLPWAAFDRVPTYEQRTLSPDPTSMGTARADKHPQHMYLYDPVPDKDTLAATSTAQYYEVDTGWWESTGNGGRNGALVDGDGDFEYIRVHPEYLAWCFFGQDTRNLSEAGAFESGMLDKYTGANDGGYTVADARDGAAGFLSFTRDGVTRTGNGLPNLTRLQSIKYAIIRTYINEQLKVLWGLRFLKMGTTGFQENGRSSPGDVYNSGNTSGTPTDRDILRLFRPTSANTPDVTMRYIQRMGAPNNTPLTFAYLNTLAQMASTDNGTSGSVFQSNASDPYKFENPIPSCRRSFIVVLSDGNPNDDNSNANGSNGAALGSNDPFSGGTFPTFNFGLIAPTKSNFNIWSLAGLAAHLTPSDTDAKNQTGWPTDRDNAKVKPPFLVTSRPSGVTRRISTMTIGVSMTGTRSDASGAKKAMYRTALYGWEQRGDYEASHLEHHLPYDKTKPDRDDPLKNPFFFDAQSPEGIADALAEAFAQARTVTNTMSAPVAPLVGLGVGKQMYVGTFTTGSSKAAWDGDLLMTGMRVAGSSVTLLHRDGSALVGGVNKDSAVWSTSVMLKAKGWKNRNLYTLKPDPLNAGKFLTTPLAWNESTSETDLPNSVIGVDTTAKRRSLIRYMMGASQEAQDDATNNPTGITTNRDDLMGDIINSTPAILEFPMTTVPSSGILKDFVNANTTLRDMHFRLIIVGDNQGILHGFGEVSGFTTAGLVTAAVDELWGIIPPDLLGGLQGWRTGTIHRYQVDGSPTIYLNEQGTANGLVDGTDVVRVVCGLRKGGRSYYALSFNGNLPTTPEISWMIRPDDSTDAAISKMGFSTSTPGAARVYYGTPTGTLRDVFFIGGGLTTSDVDAAFGSGVKLGRSVIALNVYDGTLVKAWDFINDSALKLAYPNMGCIPAGTVPVEVLVGSYKAQRVYFSDFSGGLYALGTRATSGARIDSSNMSDWQVRTIFHSAYNATGGTSISTTPAIFRLPYGYPAVRTTAPTERVFTMGVVVGTGDRNDPMDLDTVNPGGGGVTYRNRLVMVLDRQDSADINNAAAQEVDVAGYSESDLANLTSVTYATPASMDVITPGNPNYYPKTKSGYVLNYHVGTLKPSMTSEWYYEKSVTSPLVLNNALFFSKFAPDTTTGVCSGAGGTTYTYRMCDVIHPVFGDGSVATSSTACSGYYNSYNDIPSELASVGMRAVLQVGEVQNAGTGTGTVAPTVIPPPPTPIMPKPRAWRVIR